MNEHLHASVGGLLSRADRLVSRARSDSTTFAMDLALSAVYPARGAVELLREASKERRVAASLSELDTLLDVHVPYWHLIWAVRVQDFHRAGLSRDSDGVVATVPAFSTIALDLSEPPRAHLLEGNDEAAKAIFVWAPPYVQVGANTEPIAILDALDAYLAGMRLLVAAVRAAA